ncbi:hypothetical protein JOM49_007045 [Amycolatopsis magusensis]|uniref:Uncharacterized protein n=1 Tax=Amycolatopsis magusensis TaxID=882444 RepID=A0ABS4Q1H3_9PSEU|nr:hypothetical protein [Amycolatopsis magusensis]
MGGAEFGGDFAQQFPMVLDHGGGGPVSHSFFFLGRLGQA